MKRIMNKNPQATLSSGQKIPLVGLGTACYPIPSSETLTSTFLAAMEVGYTHFDTAALYLTEESLGAAVAETLRRGLVKRREDLFITSKLWCTDAQSELVLPALQKTLRNLGLEYIDLYLIHWPVRIKGECKPIFEKEDIMPMDFKAVWEAMEECHKLGLTKSIGVSNFSSKKLLDLLAIAKIPPAVNQVEMNVCWQQRKLKEVCNEKGIHITAWSPLGANGTPWGSFNVMKSPILKEIADAKGKSVAQVALRWVHEQGVSVVAKSSNRERMEQNLDIFNWELTEEELYKISEIPQCRGCPGDSFVSPQGPYRTLEELWDGEQ